MDNELAMEDFYEVPPLTNKQLEELEAKYHIDQTVHVANDIFNGYEK